MFKKLMKQKHSIYTVRKAYNVEEKRGAYGGFGGERDHFKKVSVDGGYQKGN
jgi:hypothetical protein